MPIPTSDIDTPEQMDGDFHASLLLSVSHDLKTPLACIMGSLDIYQHLKGKLSEARKDALISSAMKETRRLNSFITNILDMAQLENDVPFTLESVDMGQLIRQCVLSIEPLLSQHTVHLELSARVMAEVNELYITRVLTLLLDNAVLYTPVDTGIEITLTKDDLVCWIVIRDHGPGIPDKMLPTLFHKHNRLVRKDKKSAGTGLGLPICNTIIKKHGGAIRYDKPSYGDGSVFTITLPLQHKKVKVQKKKM